MLGAPVPEATIDEHGHPRSGEHDVYAPPEAGEDRTIDAVSQPHRVEPAA